MNLSTVKALIWVLSLAVLGYLGYFVYTWAIAGQRHELTRTLAPRETMKRVLDDVPEPEPPRVALVDYERVIATFREMNWTGREAPPPPPPPEPVVQAPTEVTRPSVANKLRVLYVEVDTDAPADSVAVLFYTDSQLSSKNPGPFDRKVGENLHGALAAVRVHAVRPEGVEFSTAGFEDMEPELVTLVDAYGPGIVMVGEGGAILPSVTAIPQGTVRVVGRPDRTLQRRPNTFVLGSQDLEKFEEDHLAILTNEVRHRQYRDPRTGQWSGVQVLDVAPDSIVAQHGVKTGDVIKSINGTPVSSVSQAISYVKNNAELYTVWEVIVENAGKQRTLVFESP